MRKKGGACDREKTKVNYNSLNMMEDKESPQAPSSPTAQTICLPPSMDPAQFWSAAFFVKGSV